MRFTEGAAVAQNSAMSEEAQKTNDQHARERGQQPRR